MSKVISILSELRPEFDFASSDNFLRDGMLDSFDIVMLVRELEKAYCISISGQDILPENFTNLAAIENLLGSYEVSP